MWGDTTSSNSSGFNFLQTFSFVLWFWNHTPFYKLIFQSIACNSTGKHSLPASKFTTMRRFNYWKSEKSKLALDYLKSGVASTAANCKNYNSAQYFHQGKAYILRQMPVNLTRVHWFEISSASGNCIKHKKAAAWEGLDFWPEILMWGSQSRTHAHLKTV